MQNVWNKGKLFLSADHGAAAVYFALTAPILIGFSALGVEAGLWLITERKLQHVADTSAYAAVARSLSTSEPTQIDATVLSAAYNSGLRETDTLTWALPPTDGAYAGRGGHVEVTIERNVSRFMTRLFYEQEETVTISVRAVAALLEESGEEVCMLALSPTASPAFLVSGSGTVTVEECGFSSNSSAEDSFKMQGAKVEVIGSCLYSVGGAVVTDGLTLTDCATPQVMQRPTPDPYASLSIPDASVFSGWTRYSSSSIGASFAPTQNLIGYGEVPTAVFDGLSLQGEVSLGPGLYVVDGGELKINANSTISGDSVSFLLINGAELNIAGTATLNLSAFDPENPHHRPDPFAGLLFFADRLGAPVSHTMNGNATSDINGIVYLPNDNISYSGNSSAEYACIQIIASQLNIGGNGTLNIGCLPDKPSGSKLLHSAQRINLLE